MATTEQLRRMLEKATTRLEILRGRMEACDVGEQSDTGHRLSREEIEGWLEEQRALLADSSKDDEAAIVAGMWRCEHGHYNLASPDVCAYCDVPRQPVEGDLCGNCDQPYERHGHLEGEGATCPDRSGQGFEFRAAAPSKDDEGPTSTGSGEASEKCASCSHKRSSHLHRADGSYIGCKVSFCNCRGFSAALSSERATCPDHGMRQPDCDACLSERASEPAKKKVGAYVCTHCGHIEQREREVACWACGRGEMVWRERASENSETAESIAEGLGFDVTGEPMTVPCWECKGKRVPEYTCVICHDDGTLAVTGVDAARLRTARHVPLLAQLIIEALVAEKREEADNRRLAELAADEAQRPPERADARDAARLLEEREAVMKALDISYEVDEDGGAYWVLGKLAAYACDTLVEAAALARTAPEKAWYRHVNNRAEPSDQETPA